MGFGVKRETVFAAFRAKGIDYAPIPDTKNLVEVAAPNGEMWTEYIPPELERRAPQRLSDVYDIPLQWFYNPLMIPGDEEKKKPS
jgi:hypothetical protein